MVKKIKISSLAISAVTIFVLVASYVISPTVWYFRGWEYFDDLVYSGYASKKVLMSESGDASSKYLISRYKKQNLISVNEIGNRVTPGFDPNSKSILTVGDSQLFGSGVSDFETFPAFLAEYSGKSVYNGSRKNGMNLLNAKEFSNKWSLLIVTSTERSGFSWYCSNGEFNLQAFEKPVTRMPNQSSSMERLFDSNYLQILYKRLSGVINNRYNSLISGNIRAPKSRLIDYQHSFSLQNLDSDIKCMNSIRNAMSDTGIPVIFLLFPAAQTLYGPESPILPDDFTINYITRLSNLSSSIGIQMMDSKKCTENKAINLYSIHDTHLNNEGFKVLAKCASRFVNEKITLQ
jgi:hypothetical protein